MIPPTGNWRLGLMFASITAVSWGLLPIALKAMLDYMDPYTITWYRFLAAAMIAGGALGISGGLPRLRSLDTRSSWILFVAVAGLIGNYVLYLLGLSYASPGTTQVLIQLAPMFLLIGGLVVFRESFNALQWLGLLALVAGLVLFFHDRLAELADLDTDLGKGVALISLAALVWALYAIAQKMLHGRMTSQGVLLVIYVSASVVLLPTSAPGAIQGLSLWGLALLVFCSLNTLVAYGAFAEALKHWEATRTSAVLAITPLLTMFFGALLAALPTGYVNQDSVDALSLSGATMVVAGSAACALGGQRRRRALS
jgi:drug/metabolite transporter (DMT)-like permease